MTFQVKYVNLIAVLILGLYAMKAQSDAAADALTKVTIAVNGMMKSKSGAT
ncbi:MAG: hypothetical protein ACI9FB_002953 [Candidatus Azotimanducaceae bacterium]|jgi:hypothetical protein